MASGTNNTFRQVGLAIGIAGLGALFEGHIGSAPDDGLGHDAGHGIVARVASGSFPAGIAGPARAAFVEGLHELLLAAAVIAFFGALVHRLSCCAASGPSTAGRRRPPSSAR